MASHTRLVKGSPMPSTQGSSSWRLHTRAAPVASRRRGARPSSSALDTWMTSGRSCSVIQRTSRSISAAWPPRSPLSMERVMAPRSAERVEPSCFAAQRRSAGVSSRRISPSGAWRSRGSFSRRYAPMPPKKIGAGVSTSVSPPYMGR